MNHEHSAALCAALEQSDVLVGLFDVADALQLANAAYRAEFLRDAALPMPFSDVLRLGFAGQFGVKIDSGDIEAFLTDILPRRRSCPSRSFQTDTVGGRWLQFTETLLPDGWLLTIATDISALKRHERVIVQAHASAVRASLTDALTGVSNRRHILDLARHWIAERNRSNAPVSIAILDIDFFKQINDAHGHQVGDQVLQEFCNDCHAHLRPNDVIGRIGGEEFMLILPGTSKDLAHAVVERLRTSIRPPERTPYTFSAGIAEPHPGEELESVMRRADAALYRAKRSGRNSSVVDAITGDMPAP